MAAQPPYVPKVAGVGGHPNIDQDVPILAVFILIYLIGAVSNMTIFQVNRRKGHKFPMSTALFGFCMARVGTCVLRLAWATRPTNTRLAIAAMIFTNAGILIVYVLVLILCQRVLRATHPKLGWSEGVGWILKVSYALLLAAILLVIAFTVLSFYTLDASLRSAALWIQRGAILYMLIFNLTSLAILLLSIFLPGSSKSVDFGTGSMRSKELVLGVAAFFTLFIAGFRTGTAWASARAPSNPAWYDSKAAFYVIELGFEIVIIYLLVLTRFDRQFWVPDASSGPSDYHRIDDTNVERGTVHGKGDRC